MAENICVEGLTKAIVIVCCLGFLLVATSLYLYLLLVFSTIRLQLHISIILNSSVGIAVAYLLSYFIHVIIDSIPLIVSRSERIGGFKVCSR